ncbi:uncharacterized protein LOC112219145 [Oncorhynchus tshawytscha]|uniref:uncharacterized protein LOC112219145 n=1 Tax=Oncorhynchus tshawytscha TaxID=74940 RepID=UPI000D09C139|nr:uncharacterized protein LOC112219145 [Oncorhynchus tshawytscha]
MDYLTPCPDRYLMTLTYTTMLDSKDDSAGKDISFAWGKGVDVRVTNRLRVPLTPDNLQSLSFSIPGLHTRLNTTLEHVGLFHYGHLLVYNLPSVPADKPDKDSGVSLAPPLSCFYLGEDGGEVQGSARDDAPAGIVSNSVSPEGDCFYSAVQPEDSPVIDSPDLRGSDKQSLCSGSENFYTCPSAASLDSVPSPWSARWASAAMSPHYGSGSSPNLPSSTPTSEDHSDSNELLSVEFKGRRYVRVLSRIKPRMDEDVEASWTVTDFTKHGEPVFSLRLDFMRPRPPLPRWMEGIAERYW